MQNAERGAHRDCLCLVKLGQRHLRQIKRGHRQVIRALLLKLQGQSWLSLRKASIEQRVGVTKVRVGKQKMEVSKIAAVDK